MQTFQGYSTQAQLQTGKSAGQIIDSRLSSNTYATLQFVRHLGTGPVTMANDPPLRLRAAVQATQIIIRRHRLNLVRG